MKTIKNMKKTILSVSLAAFMGIALSAQAITPVQLTSNSTADSQPRIKGDHVVWQGKANGNFEIFYYNLASGTKTQVTSNSSDDVSPQTDGNYIVWLGDGFNGTVTYYDIASGITTTIPDVPGYRVNTAPKIANGRVTWSTGLGIADVFMYDIASGVTSNISGLVDPTNRLDDLRPGISGDSIIWNRISRLGASDPNDDICSLMIYDIATGTAGTAPDDYLRESSEYKDGKLGVKTLHDGNDREVYMYSNDILLQVTDNSVNDIAARISGNSIVWVSGADNAAEIFVATDPDADGDGVTNSFDNCPGTANSDQLDSDGDGSGDACAAAPTASSIWLLYRAILSASMQREQ